MRKFLMLVAIVTVFAPAQARAAYIVTIDDNDCAGAFGQGFSNCKIPSQYDANQSPVIIKFDFNENGTISQTEINSALFPSISGSEFSFNFVTGAGDTADTADGIWTYIPGPNDPNINFFVAKGGNAGFNLFSHAWVAGTNTDTWITPNTASGAPAGLSHLTFYDTGGGSNGGSIVPEPSSLLLLGSGLFAAAAGLRRRIRK